MARRRSSTTSAQLSGTVSTMSKAKNLKKKLTTKLNKTAANIKRHQLAPYRLRQDPTQTLPFDGSYADRHIKGDKPMDHIYREAILFLSLVTETISPSLIKAKRIKEIKDKYVKMAAKGKDASRECHNMVKEIPGMPVELEMKEGFRHYLDSTAKELLKMFPMPHNEFNCELPHQGMLVRWYVSCVSHWLQPSVVSEPLTTDNIIVENRINDYTCVRFLDSEINAPYHSVGYTKLHFLLGQSDDKNRGIFPYYKTTGYAPNTHADSLVDCGLAEFILTRESIRTTMEKVHKKTDPNEAKARIIQEFKQFSQDYEVIRRLAGYDTNEIVREPCCWENIIPDDILDNLENMERTGSGHCSSSSIAPSEDDDNDFPVHVRSRVKRTQLSELTGYITYHPSLTPYNRKLRWVAEAILKTQANRDKFMSATLHGLTYKDWPLWALYNYRNTDLSSQNQYFKKQFTDMLQHAKDQNVDIEKQTVVCGLDDMVEMNCCYE